jgi:hypothetical protein
MVGAPALQLPCSASGRGATALLHALSVGSSVGAACPAVLLAIKVTSGCGGGSAAWRPAARVLCIQRVRVDKESAQTLNVHGLQLHNLAPCT